MKKNIKRISIFLVVIIVFVVIYSLLSKGQDSADIYTTEVVKKGDIVQTVSETGTVKSDSEINLSFENSGKLLKKYVNIGDVVTKDTILAEIDHAGLIIGKNEAQASLDLAKLQLNKLLSGATVEDKAISMANLQQANSAYVSAKKEMTKVTALIDENIAQAEKALQDLELDTSADITAVEQAVKVAEINLENTKSTYQKTIDDSKDSAITSADNKLALADIALDALDHVINNDDYEDVYGIKNSSTIAASKYNYNKAIDYQLIAKNYLGDARNNKTDQNIFILLDSVQTYLNLVFNSSQSCYEALEESITSSFFTQASLDGLKSIVSTQQTTITASITAVESAKQGLNTAVLNYNSNTNATSESLTQSMAALNDAKNSARNALFSAKTSGQQQITLAQSKVDATLKNLELAEVQRNKVIAPANRHDVALSQAQLRQAEVHMDSVLNNIEKCFIKSPIDGTITKFAYEIGEQATMGSPVVSMLGENNFKIEVLISEADIAKVNNNDLVEITLDSYGDDVKFTGKIYFIEPAETEIQDVIYYKVKINFESNKYDIKSGMTANVVITTDSRYDVITVPSRAIIDKNGHGKFIKVLSAGIASEKKIEVGLRGDGGLVEIKSGLNAGENVVTYTKTSK